MTSVAWTPAEPVELAAWRDAAARHMTAVRTRAGEVGFESAVDRDLADALTNVPAGGPALWRLDIDDAPAGWAWLRCRDGRTWFADLTVPDDISPEVAAALRTGLLTRARQAGARELGLSLFAGDAVMAAVAPVERELVATHMQIRAAEVPAAQRIGLRPMTPARFATFERHSLDHYAQETFTAGAFATVEAARRSSRESFATLLPCGVQTPEQLLWSAYDGATEVGVLWIALQPGRGFIFDIEVEPDHRRQGYGTQILRAGAQEADRAGRTVLALNVWGSNPGAKALYDRCGYVTTEEIFQVPLGD